MASGAERALSFGAVADDYDRLRPAPPDEAMAWLVPAGCQVAADLGAGTGLLSRALAAMVPQVIAVEPDPRMRAVLAARSPGLRVLAGTGEAIPLPDASVDGVFVSSAWHWMDPDRAVPEIARVLRDGGRFGVIGTGPDRSSGWADDLGLRRPAAGTGGRPGAGSGPDEGGPEYDEPRDEHDETRDEHDETQDGHERGDERRAGRDEVLLPEGAPFSGIATASFPFTRPMTIDQIVAMLGTYSRFITRSPQDRSAELARVRARLAERYGDAGEIDVPMRSRCWRADRTARESSGPR